MQYEELCMQYAAPKEQTLYPNITWSTGYKQVAHRCL